MALFGVSVDICRNFRFCSSCSTDGRVTRSVERATERRERARERLWRRQQGLSGLLTLLGAARQTVRTIWINFAASLSYNLLAAALAMAGYIHPIAAAILMPLSSVTVVLIAFLNPAFRKFES